ncbi:MAG: 50S ribosomal protein L10 [Candidatus Hodarchaeales archaeon]
MAAVAIEERKINKKKIEQIDTIVDLAENYSVIAVANLSGISSKALQGIRMSMRSGDVKAKIKVAKNTIKSLALEEAAQKIGKDLKKLIPFINGSCALVFTNTNPFKLQKFLNRNQVPAPAKTGQISPVDVYIPEGSTNLDPGPIISELGSIGLETRIDKGKIRITKTAKVLSVGDTVTETHASVLSRLGIHPFKVGLKLSSVFEDNEIIDGSVLDIDEKQIISDLRQAYLNALSLAIDPKVSYITKETLPILLSKASSQAMSLSLETGFVTEKTAGMLLAKTRKEASLLKDKVKEKDSNIDI